MISVRPRTLFVAGGAVFVALAVAVALLFRQQVQAEAIRSQEAQNVVLARTLANVLWPRFAGHVRGATPAGLVDLRASAMTNELNREIAKVIHDIPVLRVKIYDLAGLTVFSSNLGQIGESRADHPGFRAAVDKRIPSSVLSFRESFAGFADMKTSVYLVETYVPVLDAKGEIAGVFELYSEVNAAFARVRAATIRFGAIVVLGLGLLYAGLIFVVRRG